MRLLSLKRSAVLEMGIVFVVSLALAFVYLHPILGRWYDAGVRDYDFDQMWHGAARRSILQFGQIPLWNPYEAGGQPLLANPESRILTPFFVLHLVFGTIVGTKLSLILHLVLGLIGMYCLARHFKLDRIIAWLPAAAFVLNSKFALHATEGLGNYMSTMYLPWTLLFYLKSYQRSSWILMASVCQTMIFLDGGHYYIIISLTFFGFLSCLLVRQYGFLKPILRMLFMAVLTICLGAIKFFPAIVCLLDHPNENTALVEVVRADEGITTQELVDGLFDRDQRMYSHLPSLEMQTLIEKIAAYSDQQRRQGTREFMYYIELPEWTDKGMYVGWGVWYLFLLGLVVWGKRLWCLAVAVAVFFWLSLGGQYSLSLWKLISWLPPYDNMLEVVRFDVISLLIMSIFAGLGLQYFQKALSSGYVGRSLVACVLPVLVLTVLWERLSVPTSDVAADRIDLFLIVSSLVSVFVTRYVLGELNTSIADLNPPTRMSSLLAFGFLLLIIVDLLTVNSVILKDPQTFPIPPQTIIQQEPFVQTSATGGWGTYVDRWEDYGLYHKFLANRGAVDAPVSFNYPRAAVPIGSPQYAGEFWLLPLATADSAANKAAQQVTLKQWSLNKLAFSVRSNIPVALVVNQCYDSGWKAKRGNSRNPVIDVAGLIGVPLPAGEYEVQLAYFPWSFIFGVVISLISLGVIVTMAFCLRKQPTTAKPGV